MTFDEMFRDQLVRDLEDRGKAENRIARLSRILSLWLVEEGLGENYDEWLRVGHAATELAIFDELYPAGADPEHKYMNPRPPVH